MKIDIFNQWKDKWEYKTIAKILHWFAVTFIWLKEHPPYLEIHIWIFNFDIKITI